MSTTEEIKLPELGEGVTEGELIKWLVKVGDSIEAEQNIAEIMTDKATVEVPSTVGGKVKELKFKAGDLIPIDSVLLVVEVKTGSGSTVASPATKTETKPAAAVATPATVAASAITAAIAPTAEKSISKTSTISPPLADLKVLATPATRLLAREMGLDINNVKGTGLAGRVTREDILSVSGEGEKSSSALIGHEASTTKASSSPTKAIPRPAYLNSANSSSTPEERIPLRGIRKKIAESMQMAKAVIPHFTLMDEADITDLVKMREGLKEFADSHKTKITYLPLAMKALISTCREFSSFNASIDDQAQEIVYKSYFNIGFAADTPNGLVVPVLKQADQKSILELSQEILDLSRRAREGKLKLDEMKGATITITNIGSVGGTYATPIINHPEVAILGMYKIQDKVCLNESGAVIQRKTMNFTITADHRLIDGAVAARFLKSFINKLEKPGLLMMDLR